MDSTLLKPELATVELQRLVKKLAFAEDDFEKANLEQAKLSLQASMYRVEAMKLKHRRQAVLEKIRAEKALAFGKIKHGQKRGQRMTQAEIQNRVMVDPNVRKAQRRFEEALELEEFSVSLVYAYRQRQTTLRIVTDIRNGEIANDIRSVREGMARDTMDKMSNRARRVLRKRGDDVEDEEE